VPRLILLLAIAFALYILVRRVQSLPPHKQRAAYLQLIFGGIAVGAILLTLMGKMHWVGAAITGLIVGFRQLLPVLIRAFPLLQKWLAHRQQQSQGQQSEVRSTILRMTLDHSNGELAGEVISGPFKDWFLNEMSRAQLDELMVYCRSQDEDSVQLLESYLAQRFPGDDETSQSNDQRDQSDSGAMNRSEALAILGLSDDASDEAIISAHRSLIQKLHPDRGGNDYLAAKINQAKDFLLKR